jgi:hypothetical protein
MKDRIGRYRRVADRCGIDEKWLSYLCIVFEGRTEAVDG